MVSVSTTLRSQGMELHGNDGEGNREIKDSSQRESETTIEILDEHILHKSGCFERVRRWIRGCHPKLGVLIQGHTGWETVQEYDRIRPMHTFTVINPPEST